MKDMDLDLLSKILRELVLKNNRVSLPGMGSFIAEKAPSVFSDRAMVIHPPFRRILFRPSEIWNDELLESKYAQEQGCTIEVAKEQIAKYIKTLRADLNENKSYRIPQFGTMRATEQNDYFFVADKDLFNYAETFGLEPVNIKFLPRRGEVESLSGKPVTNFFKKDLKNIQNSASTLAKEELVLQEEEPAVVIEPVEEPTVVLEQEEEPTVVLEQVEEPTVVLEQVEEPTVVLEQVEEPTVVLEQEEEPAVVIEPVEKPTLVVEPPIPIANPIVQAEPTQPSKPPAPIVPQVAVGQPALKESKPVESKRDKQPSVDTDKLDLEKASSSKFIRNFVITLSIIFLVILIFALLVLFKEELKPFWEWVLYSKEEREVLRSSISSALR